MGRNNNGYLYLIRGASGAGKSFIGNMLMTAFSESKNVMLGADDFWIDSEGNYNFDSSRLSEAHQWNEGRTKQAMQDRVDNIIVPNTFLKEDHLTPYIILAEIYGYEVKVITVQRDTFMCITENSWNVPPEIVRKNTESLEQVDLDALIKRVRFTLDVAQNKLG